MMLKNCHEDNNNLWFCVIITIFQWSLSFRESFYRGFGVKLDCLHVQHTKRCLAEFRKAPVRNPSLYSREGGRSTAHRWFRATHPLQRGRSSAGSASRALKLHFGSLHRWGSGVWVTSSGTFSRLPQLDGPRTGWSRGDSSGDRAPGRAPVAELSERGLGCVLGITWVGRAGGLSLLPAAPGQLTGMRTLRWPAGAWAAAGTRGRRGQTGTLEVNANSREF